MKILQFSALLAAFHVASANAEEDQHPLRGTSKRVLQDDLVAPTEMSKDENEPAFSGGFAEGNTYGDFAGLPPASEWTPDLQDRITANLAALDTMIKDQTAAGILIVAALASVCNPLLTPPEYKRCEYWAQYRGSDMKTMKAFFEDWLYFVPIPVVANITDPSDPLNEPDGPGFYIQRWDWLANTSPGRELILDNEEFKPWMTEFLTLHGDYLDTEKSFDNYPGKDFGPFELWKTYAGTKAHPFDINDYVLPLGSEEGFATYGQFFLRETKAGIRPLGGDGNENVIVSPCDGGMFYLSHGTEGADPTNQHELPGKSGDTFGLEESIPGYGHAFAGGKIFDILLWFTDYHHFNAPVSGTIIYKQLIPGTYNYDFRDFNPEEPFTMAESEHSDNVQWYQTIDKHNRYAIVFATENLGLVAMIPVGFWGVGTMEVYPEVGTKVEKGDHIGHFLYGGSSIVLAFEPGKDLSFVWKGLEVSTPDHPRLVKVKEEVGQLVPPM